MRKKKKANPTKTPTKKNLMTSSEKTHQVPVLTKKTSSQWIKLVNIKISTL